MGGDWMYWIYFVNQNDTWGSVMKVYKRNPLVITTSKKVEASRGSGQEANHNINNPNSNNRVVPVRMFLCHSDVYSEILSIPYY